MTYAARIARLEATAPASLAFRTGCPACEAPAPAGTLSPGDGPPQLVPLRCACGAAFAAFTLTLGERVLPAGGAA
jgi:hypothetical protein